MKTVEEKQLNLEGTSTMRSHTYHLVSIALLIGGLCLAPLAFSQTKKMTTEHDHSTHQHTDICAGFVVLPNGYAVLSAMEPGSTSGMKHGMQHGAGHGQAKSMAHKSHAQHSGNMKPTDHLMGHRHGDDIPAGKDMLCVPIGEMANTSWTSVSASPGLHVTAQSIKGTLAHNSRANESLSFNIMRDGKLIEQANVQVLARMPHHDHRMPGGHGPANDPDVTGIEAALDAQGRYTVSTVDFSMAGVWLFEIRIQQNGQTHKAYFAAAVGEE